jgi:hypothetical protein
MNSLKEYEETQILWRGSDGNLMEGLDAAAAPDNVGRNKHDPAPASASAIPPKNSRRVVWDAIARF